ncbi:MAG TPA: hypothetical protein VFZ65_03090, partial [Planctomycetota bacterium]|nr:hypothetical protein [Planctomycetota bacterium]
WIRASHGLANGEALVQAAPPDNVVHVTITLAARARDALLRLVLASDDGGPLGAFDVRQQQMRLGEPGSYELEGEPTDRGVLYHCCPGVFRLRIRPKFQSAGMIHGCFTPFERVVELRSGTETLVEQQVCVGGRVQFRVHLPDTTADLDEFTVATPAASSMPPGTRNEFIRTRPDGWESGPPHARVPMLWGPLLPPGRHVLTFSARGYADLDLAIDVRRREITDLDVYLQPKP